MAWDWQRFLDQHRVDYAQSGANTSRDNVTVHCPFCGTQDPSKHMSVNLSGKGWRCWRNSQHRGKSPTRLVAAMIGVSLDRAAQITGTAIFITDDFMSRVRAELDPPKDVKPTPLKMPPEFKAFTHLPSARPYEDYLRRRGFSDKQIDRMTDRWGLRYCTRGAYAGRIIFPIRYKGDLVAWTGRTISARDELRYRALSTDPERAEREGHQPALGAISHFLLWYDYLREADADTIILAEGPFDALKMNVLGRQQGIVSSCFFTSEPTEPQTDLLHELLPRFRHRYMLLDRGTFATGIRVANNLATLGMVSQQLPIHIKDPGEFDLSTWNKFVLALRRGGR